MKNDDMGRRGNGKYSLSKEGTAEVGVTATQMAETTTRIQSSLSPGFHPPPPPSTPPTQIVQFDPHRGSVPLKQAPSI